MAFCADQQMPLPAPGGAPTITGQHQPALFAWLDEFMHQAMPLWPNEETAMDTQERWLLTPPSKPAATLSNRQSAPWIDGTEMIDAWAALQPNLLRSSSQVDAIMVLRWVALEEVDQDESW